LDEKLKKITRNIEKNTLNSKNDKCTVSNKNAQARFSSKKE
jgi:hypothetical protein